MREPLDPFSSLRTSNVFFQMILGRTAPKDIASYLKTKPPGVVEHLRRLQAMGVVELGQKEGKYQNYRVVWEKFVVVLLERIYTPRFLEFFTELEDKGVFRSRLELEKTSLKQVIAELKSSEKFRDVVRIYFEVLVMNMNRGFYPRRTVQGMIYSFEESLESVPSLFRLSKKPEMKNFLKLLEKLNAFTKHFKKHGPQAAFESAVYAAFNA